MILHKYISKNKNKNNLNQNNLQVQYLIHHIQVEVIH